MPNSLEEIRWLKKKFSDRNYEGECWVVIGFNDNIQLSMKQETENIFSTYLLLGVLLPGITSDWIILLYAEEKVFNSLKEIGTE